MYKLYQKASKYYKQIEKAVLEGQGLYPTVFGQPVSQVHQNKLFFNPLVHRMIRGGGISEQTRYELWMADGTQENTQQLATTKVSDEGFTVFNGRLFFSGSGPDGQELWVTDGNPGGVTKQVLDLTPDKRFSPEPCPPPPERLYQQQVCLPSTRIKSTEVRSLIAHGNFLYFIALDGDIYRTDGTVKGTQHVYRFDGWPYRDFPASIVKAGDKLFVMAYENDSLKLWALPE